MASFGILGYHQRSIFSHGKLHGQNTNIRSAQKEWLEDIKQILFVQRRRKTN